MMNSIIYNSLVFLGITNLVSFLVMFWDKRMSQLGKRRISEKALFFLALFFGGLGIYFGMFIFRHKTQKWYFVVGIPLIIALNIYLAIRWVVFYLAS